MMMINIINNFFNLFTNPKIKIYKLKIPAFRFLGFSGYILGFIFIILMTIRLSLNLMTSLFVLGICSITFLSYNLIKKAFTGKEIYVFYEQLLIIYIITFLGLKIIKQPILPYLDLLSYDMAIINALGRIGCLKAGCCFGRPSFFGICYPDLYRLEGVPNTYINKRLFPVQFVESILVCIIIIIGSLIILPDFKPGTGLIFYLTSYTLIRFFLEFKRNDPIRKYILSFSEAQWSGLIIILAITILQITGLLHFYPGLFIYTLSGLMCMIIFMLIILMQSRQYSLLLPKHISEIAEILESFPRDDSQLKSIKKEDINIRRTSKGLLISKGIFDENNTTKLHFTFSHESFKLNRLMAGIIGRQILYLSEIYKYGKIIKGNNGIYHVISEYK